MSKPPETIGRATLWQGDCREVLATFDADSIDAVVTDPPAGISFMGRDWDHHRGGRAQWIAWMETIAAECLRIAKPGAHALVWALPRTSHWTATAWENAGWTVRDRLAYLFGSGFPKGQTNLKPACEDWWLLRKPLIGTVAQNVLAHGTGTINVDACRVAVGANDRHDYGVNGDEPSVAGNGITHGHLARVAYEQNTAGRWPANVLHDGSDEVEAAFAAFGERTSGSRSGEYANGTFSSGTVTRELNGNTGSASRFFYCAKADADERAGSKHPTVKPLSLMRWLVRLITPPGGTVLDPFAGSGTTGEAAMLEGCSAVLIEREATYMQDIRHRLGRASGADTPLFADTA